MNTILNMKESPSTSEDSNRRYPSGLHFSSDSRWLSKSFVLLYPLLLLSINLPGIVAFVQPNGLCLIPPHHKHRPTLSHPLTHGVPSLTHHHTFTTQSTQSTHQHNRMNILTLDLLHQKNKKEDYGAFAVTAENGSIESPDIDENGKDPKNDQEDDISKDIFALAVPALAALAIDPLMTLADTAFVGRNADNSFALAGLGQAAAILTFSFYLFNFLCTVTTPLVSQRRAAGEERDAILLGGQALSLAILLGAMLTVVLIAGSQPLLNVMGAGSTGAEANAYATSFLIIRAFAAPAYFVISAATGILRGYLDTRTAFVILLLANGINFGLDVVLISMMDMGPTGAAIATTTAEWISALSFLGILAGKIPSVDGVLGSNQNALNDDSTGFYSELSTQDESNGIKENELEMVVVTPVFDIPTWENVQPLVVASSSAFVRSFVLQLSIAGAAAMAARSGGADIIAGDEVASASIAAHQIALQLWLLGSFVCDALAAASQALVADRLGKDDLDGVRNVSNAIFGYSLVLGIILATALAVGDASGFLLSFFTDDEATREAMKPLILILIGAQPLNAFVFSADGVIQGASLFAYQAKTMVLSAVVAVASFVSLQVVANDPSTTLQHVWYGLIILQVMRGLTSLWKLVDTEGPIDLFQRR